MEERDEVLSWLTSSQRRIFPSDMPTHDITHVSGLRNEAISFFVGYRVLGACEVNRRLPDRPISVRVHCKTLPVSVYKVGYVPCENRLCEDAPSGSHGGVPDLLWRRSPCPELEKAYPHIPFYEVGERTLLQASALAAGSLCVTLNEAGEAVSAGDHTVSVEVISLKTGEVLRTHVLTVHVVDALLPESDLLYTNWFHYDCLADHYGLTVWSPEYEKVLRRFLRNAVLHGMNTLLTPAFTPSLDIPVGMERKNVQLVRVVRENGKYTFDFSALARFVRLAKECGIRYFEHCQLFSQWGARCAINIYGEENGAQRLLFGWDTPADGEEYTEFLRQYLVAFLAFAQEMGIEQDMLFHVSDEPAEGDISSYKRAREVVEQVLHGQRVGDPLSHYALYEKGLVDLPIVNIPYADDFDGKCPRFWLYYTGGEPHQERGYTNRLLTSAPWRTRILGTQLFRYRCGGFLHWGYNYTYGRMSRGRFDPAMEPCAYKDLPGVSYLVYPGADRTPCPSLREKQMCEAMNDYRALKLLETYIGYDATLALCEQTLGMSVSVTALPASGEAMLALREAINQRIEEAAR